MSLRSAEHRPRLVLASASPRRARLLRDAGFECAVQPPPLDDAALDPGDCPAQRWVAAAAYLKASATLKALLDRGERDVVVLGADTVVDKDSRIIGQPRDADDARRILHALSSGGHVVRTGVAIVAPSLPRDIFSDAADVRVGALTDAMIEAYVASGQWRGKAGAYNLEERIAEGWPIAYTGDPGTIMGLPMLALAPRLRRALEPTLARSAAARGSIS